MEKLKKAINNADVVIAGICLVLIVSITVAGVIMRKVVNRPIAWLEEMQLLFFIYCIFFGGSVAFRYGSQVSIDLIANRLKGKARQILMLFDLAVTVVILCYYSYGGFLLMKSVTKKVTPYFKINYMWIDLAAPIGLILMALQYILYVRREVKGIMQPGEGKMKGGEEV